MTEWIIVDTARYTGTFDDLSSAITTTTMTKVHNVDQASSISLSSFHTLVFFSFVQVLRDWWHIFLWKYIFHILFYTALNLGVKFMHDTNHNSSKTCDRKLATDQWNTLTKVFADIMHYGLDIKTHHRSSFLLLSESTAKPLLVFLSDLEDTTHSTSSGVMCKCWQKKRE